jgi:hypothetical protein
MAERFPRIIARVQNAQNEFEREREAKLRVFVDSFIEEYHQ